MNVSPLRIHVLYESTYEGQPHGCSEIRLLRPLSHPALQPDVVLTSGLTVSAHPVDVVIVERFWGHYVGYAHSIPVLEELCRRGTPLIFEIDDDLFSFNADVGSRDEFTTAQKMWLRWMMRLADGVIVSTPNLASRLTQLNANIEVVHNALDDRLFHQSRSFPERKVDENRLVFGYMGTPTHVEDLFSIIEPLRRSIARHRDKVIFEIVGIGDSALIDRAFQGLPVSLRAGPPDFFLYEKFTDWMQENLRWDFGIAPLMDSTFNRSKSDIKFLDYAVQGIPGIFSKVPAYRDSVKHLNHGIVVSSNSGCWEEWLEKMIQDRDLRLRLAKSAHSYAWKNRMLETRARDWITAIQNIISRISNKPKKFISVGQAETEAS